MYKMCENITEIYSSEESNLLNIDNEYETTLLRDDTCHYLGIFPEVVWHSVSKHVINLQIAPEFANASPYFRDLTLRNRTIFLFPQVWNVLWTKYKAESDSKFWRNFHTLPLRLVCKAWCSAVDNVHDNNPLRYTMAHDPNPFSEYKFEAKTDHGILEQLPKTVFKGENLETVHKFNSHFEQTHGHEDNTRNPFLGRRIAIQYRNADRAFFELLHDILSKFGHHIWYCTLLGNTKVFQGVTYYNRTKEILQFLPNLRALVCCNMDLDQQVPKLFRLYQQANSEMEAVIGEHPLKQMAHLKYLNCSNVPGPIFKEMVRQAGNLKMLQVQRQNMNDLLALEIPKLERFSVELRSVNEFLMLNEVQVNWQLNTLYLDIRVCPMSTWSQIFNLIESKWANSLTSLALLLKEQIPRSDANNFDPTSFKLQLNLPRLKRLKLIIEYATSLDFILPTKDNLEYLRVDILYDYRKSSVAEQEQTIQFLGYFEKGKKDCKSMLESNVWKLFPKLKKVDVWDGYGAETQIFKKSAGSNNKYTNYYCGCSRKEWLNYIGKM